MFTWLSNGYDLRSSDFVNIRNDTSHYILSVTLLPVLSKMSYKCRLFRTLGNAWIIMQHSRRIRIVTEFLKYYYTILGNIPKIKKRWEIHFLLDILSAWMGANYAWEPQTFDVQPPEGCCAYISFFLFAHLLFFSEIWYEEGLFFPFYTKYETNREQPRGVCRESVVLSKQ